MKNIYIVLTVILMACATKTIPAEKNITSKGFYDLKMNAIDGKEIQFTRYQGKKVLIVNTASECGFTPQYAELQSLQDKYKDKLVVLGFPCNQFGGQESKNETEIVQFCTKNYGVTFQLFEKSDVKGNSQNEVFKWLTTKELNGWNTEVPSWNFGKYLVDEKGVLVKVFPSNRKPLDQEVLDAVEK